MKGILRENSLYDGQGLKVLTLRGAYIHSSAPGVVTIDGDGAAIFFCLE